MTRNRFRSRILGLSALAVTITAAAILAACQPAQNKPLLTSPPSSPQVSTSICAGTGACRTKCAECILSFTDEFICVGGGCTVTINRTCTTCALLLARYRIEDGTAKAGVDYVGVSSGEVVFPAGTKSASITVKTLPKIGASLKSVKVIASVDGVDLEQKVGTIRGG